MHNWTKDDIKCKEGNKSKGRKKEKWQKRKKKKVFQVLLIIQ